MIIMRNIKRKNIKLDKEEIEIINSIERGEWVPVKNMGSEIARYTSYAKHTLKKDQRISIRISKQDLVGIQEKAIEDGIPYQTLISSIVHRYVRGGLIAKAC